MGAGCEDADVCGGGDSFGGFDGIAVRLGLASEPSEPLDGSPAEPVGAAVSDASGPIDDADVLTDGGTATVGTPSDIGDSSGEDLIFQVNRLASATSTTNPTIRYL
jgi:hypothetical protein